jgi:uncharacterized repeat protein (TIGR03833 family)
MLGAGQRETKSINSKTLIESPSRGLPEAEGFAGDIRRVGTMDGKRRINITTGLAVRIVLKKDQRSGNLTEGVVKDILTKSPTHPHGIKVRLESGAVGRVKEIIR